MKFFTFLTILFNFFQALYKRVRGILNKLTPEKFTKLVGQVKELPINNLTRLEGVIDLVFKKVRISYCICVIFFVAIGKRRESDE